MADARRLVEAAIIPPLAAEIAAQIDAGVGNRSRLVELGMVSRLAIEVASSIGGTASATRLVELGLAGVTARELAAQIGGSTPTPTPTPSVTPLLNDWRAPVTAAYDSNNVAADMAALAASSTAKTLPETIVAGNATRTIAMDVGAIAAPGGMLYFSTKYSGAWTITVDQSTDSGATWASLGFTPQAPNTATGTGTMGKYNDRGQWVLLAAGAARRVRIVATTSDGTALSIFPGVFQFRADGQHPFFMVHGTSIEQLSTLTIETRDYWRMLYPNSDPIFINWGLFGNTWSQVYTRAIQPMAALNLPFSSYMFGGNGNDYFQSRPFATDTAGKKAQMRTDLDQCLTALAATGKPLFAATVVFSDINENPSNANTNGTNNPENGARPYIETIYIPANKSASPASQAASIDAPVYDEYSSALARYETELLTSDHIHLTQTGNIDHQLVWAPMARTLAGDARGNSWIEGAVARTGAATSPWYKNRLQQVAAQLPTTADATALTNRATLIAAVNGRSTTYVDPTGVTLPSALPGGAPVVWFDPAKWDTVTTQLATINTVTTGPLTGTINSTTTITGYAYATDTPIGAAISGAGIPAGATVVARDQAAKTITISAAATGSASGVALTVSGAGGRIASFLDRTGNTTLAQTAYASQPAYRDHAVNGYATISPILATNLSATAGPLLSSLTAAGQPFTLGFMMFTNPFASQGDVMGWNNGGTILGIVGPAGGAGYGAGLAGLRFFGDGTGRAQETARYEPWKPYWIVIVYDGTTVTIYRNGVQTAAGAWAKAAWAPTVFRYGCRAAGTNFTQHDLGDLVLLNRAVAGSELTTLNAYRGKWAIA